MNWIKQFIDRCKAQTPRVFRKVQYIAGAMSAMMIAVNSQAMEYAMQLPSWWNASAPYIIWFSAGLVALSQFTQSYDSNGNPIYKSENV